MPSTKLPVILAAIIVIYIRSNGAVSANTNKMESTDANSNMSKLSNAIEVEKRMPGNMYQISGGRLLEIKEVPYQIALFRNNFFICGGSILSQDWIVTAAHCVYGGGHFGIRVGSANSGKGGQIRFINTVVINGGFTSLNLQNDIAMLRVDKPFIWSSSVLPIRLAANNTSIPEKLFVSGWASVGENSKPELHLRGATLEVVSNKECRSAYKKKYSITEDLICTVATGRDACQGDYGGPLAHKGVLYGIISFGVGCESFHVPTVYTSVHRQYRWIMNVARRYGGQEPMLAQHLLRGPTNEKP
ncbi:trypsin beta-like [Stomoxys calcitrans]|uniref:trypsin beta-like n=1 Tax=Stomoxys calcitrans TaxID=35570 RepID=UPI0027E26332|nr:trypsin beta-like [Stomoxys calcitrans]